MNYTQALDILHQYIHQDSLLRHAHQVADTMAYLAAQSGEDAATWRIVGLLHDVDYEQYPAQHCQKASELLAAANVPADIIRAVVSHGYGICSDVEPLSRLEKTLFAIDELTGLIWAGALMRPSKSTLDMEVKSIKKKFKDKHFAAGVDRDLIRRGAAMLNVELDALIAMTLAGMQDWERSSAA